MNIKMPDEHEKGRSIETILSKGISRPKSFVERISEIYRSLGYRCIFWDTADSILLSSAISIGIAVLWAFSSSKSTYGMLFAISPVLYLLLALFTDVKERIGGLYELKMTCKFTIRQITAFRMICFSGIGIAFSVLMSTLSCLLGGFQNYDRMLITSLCALFLCSFLTLFTMMHIRGKWSYYTPPVIWSAICILPVLLFGEQWELLISRIPMAANLCVIAIVGWLYLREIKKLICCNEREVVSYVNG